MENLLQGFGIVACVGALLLIVAVVLIARTVMGRRNNTGGLFGGNTPAGYGDQGGLRDRDDEILTRRGSERPTYDTDEVRTQGGYGASIPNTGSRADRFDEDDDSLRQRRTLNSYDQPGGGPLRDLDTDDVRPTQPPRRGNILRRRRGGGGGDIQSGGGFGGG